MPLTGQYTWSETLDTLNLEVPLKGTRKGAVDIYVSDVFVKLNFAPYLIALDIPEPVDDQNVVARFEGGSLYLTLKKQTPVLWKRIKVDGDRKTLRARREASMAAKSERDADLRKRKNEKAVDDERAALRSHMSMEEAERRELDDVKQEEKSNAEAEVYKTLARVQAEAEAGQGKGRRKRRTGKAKAAIADGAAHVGAATTSSGGVVVEDEEDWSDVDSDEPGDEHAVAPGRDGDGAAGGDGDDDEAPSADPVYESEEARRRGAAAEAAAAALLAEETAEQLKDAEAARNAAVAPVTETDIFDEDDVHEGSDFSDDEDVEYVPPPRETVKNTISFTERVFPTPLRESKVAEENKWVEKNRKGLEMRGRLKPKNPEARDISERDPVWLKGRGDDFFRGGDYLSAVNAYTAALEADPSLLTCLTNRSACFLQLGQSAMSVRDCNAALRRLPAVPGVDPPTNARSETEDDDVDLDDLEIPTWVEADDKTRRMVVKLLVRRGTAQCQDGDYAGSLHDYRAALSAHPHDASLKEDVERVERLVKCAAVKAEGDALFGEGKLADAAAKFTAALEIEPTFVSCVSNRAAVYLATERFAECVEDCTAALALLDPDGEVTGADVDADAIGEPPASADAAGSGSVDGAGASGAGATAAETGGDAGSAVAGASLAPPQPTGPIPPAGSDKRRQWLLKTLVRRGTALLRADKPRDAVDDFKRALRLEPGNKALAKDVKRLEARLRKANAAAAGPGENVEGGAAGEEAAAVA